MKEMNVMKEMSIKEGNKERDMEEGKEEKNTNKDECGEPDEC